ncbi:MAG: carbamoyl-phosphate synthase small subunit [Gammaproteobacteria bacterium CG_4_10_14_0_8_um_filter_38_16]|nr:MAG: carbamoyl-phosphate synthase small subunit [Gammaproteobacteria bacterium CG_4_10_14_0_8_um_filter_38_16]PJA03746.1 MAG: carbamoyl-phosphate synthase small subunit [Gammaproteobacteria bacterium CG_4_10_14_0_2_um_filter_38_22]PJB09923.1 MAG: carbamoyl-phosphate synthase small subunit [Gammaproteobacteria bacterium CG_4_9_14_3_um_filter_38_9]
MNVAIFSDSVPALLALADGTVFEGVSIGASGETVGEVVFNTAMTGYQEMLTDPSYSQQIITLTYPHIGNTGINNEDNESDRIFAAGFIVRELSLLVSNYRATESLPAFLKRQNIIAIANIDTRCLTRLLREKGVQNGCIMTGKVDPALAIQKARAFAGLKGKDLAITVTTQKNYDFADVHAPIHHVVVYDFGVKRNILKLLAERHCKVTVVPAQTSVAAVMQLNPSGIVLSNGPGDPAACHYAIEHTKKLLAKNIPILGICLGFQILALAYGATTEKMKFGHHGANHPVQDLRTKKVCITSQNHSFCVDKKTLPDDLIITHISLFDQTVQGFKHKHQPVIAFQGHPEAGPGPNDMVCLFDEFVEMLTVN